jgi:hypothetical protein
MAETVGEFPEIGMPNSALTGLATTRLSRICATTATKANTPTGERCN